MALKINTGNIIILQRISGLTKTAGVYTKTGLVFGFSKNQILVAVILG